MNYFIQPFKVITYLYKRHALNPLRGQFVAGTVVTHNFITAYYCVCQVLCHMKLCQYQSFSCSKVSEDYKNVFMNENYFII